MAAHITERGAHDDGLVAILLIIIEDLLYALDTRVVISNIVLSRLVLVVPIQNTTNKR